MLNFFLNLLKAGQSLTRNESKDERLWKEIGEEVRRDTDKLFKMIGEAYAVLSDPAKVKTSQQINTLQLSFHFLVWELKKM